MGWGIGFILVLLGFGIMVLCVIPATRRRLPDRCRKVDGHMIGFHVLGSGAMLSSVLWWIGGSEEMSILALVHAAWCLGWAVLSLLVGNGIAHGLLPPGSRFSEWPWGYRLFLLVGVVSILITTGLSL